MGYNGSAPGDYFYADGSAVRRCIVDGTRSAKKAIESVPGFDQTHPYLNVCLAYSEAEQIRPKVFNVTMKYKAIVNAAEWDLILNDDRVVSVNAIALGVRSPTDGRTTRRSFELAPRSTTTAIMLLVIAAAVLLATLSGCGAVCTFYPNGHLETAEATFLKHTAIAGYEADGKGHRKIGNVTAQTDDSALASIVQGIGLAVRAFVGVP